MKKIIFLLALISLALAYYKECPSVNIGRSDDIVNCPESDEYYCKPLFDENYEEMFYQNDELDDGDIDYCRSQHLYNRKVGNEAMYYNKCCYMSFQTQGKKYQHCVGLTDDQMMDVPVTIKELEEQFTERIGDEVYIDVLLCNGKYIFYSMISSLLLALIF